MGKGIPSRICHLRRNSGNESHGFFHLHSLLHTLRLPRILIRNQKSASFAHGLNKKEMQYSICNVMWRGCGSVDTQLNEGVTKGDDELILGG